MSAAQAQLEEAKDEGEKQLSTVGSQISLLSQLALQMAKFGPVLAFRVNARTMMALPWGLVSAGAAGTAAGVDGGDPDGVANMTAIMVKMGLLNLVHDIVVRLGGMDRSDVTAAVTLGLLNLGEVTVIMQINNALIKSGHMAEGAEISKEMLKNGQMQFMDLLKEAGGSWLGGDDKKDDKQDDKQDSADNKSSWFSKLSGADDKSSSKDSSKKDDSNSSQQQQKGSSWFGSSSSPPDLGSSESKEESGKQGGEKDSAAPSKQPGTVNSVADRVAAGINSAAQAVMPVKPSQEGKSQIDRIGQQHPKPAPSSEQEPETRTL